MSSLRICFTVMLLGSVQSAYALDDYDFPYVNDFESVTSVHDDATDKNAANDTNGQADWEMLNDWGVAANHNAWTSFQGGFHLDNNPTEVDQSGHVTNQIATLNGYVNIPANSIQPVLSYYYKLDLLNTEDQISVELQVEGSPAWIILKAYYLQHNHDNYIREEIDLSPYKGQNIRVRFVQNGYWSAGPRLFVVDDFSMAELDLPQQGYPYNNDFETAAAQAQWRLSSSWGMAQAHGNWSSHDGQYHLDNNAAELDQYKYAKDIHATLDAWITLPATSQLPVLSFYYKLGLLSQHDDIYLEIQREGNAGWDLLKTYDNQYARDSYTLERFSLDAYKGENVRIRFRQSHYAVNGPRLFVIDALSIEDLSLGDFAYPYSNGFETAAEQQQWRTAGSWSITGAHDTSWTSYSGNYHLDNNRQAADQGGQYKDHFAEMEGFVSIPGNSVRPVLTYDYKVQQLYWNDLIDVKVQVRGSSSWVILKSYSYRQGRTDYSHEEIDLSAYKGQDIRLAFVQSGYWSAGTRLLVVDNVKIDELQLPVLAYPYNNSFDTAEQRQQWHAAGSWNMAASQTGRPSVSSSYHLDNNPVEIDQAESSEGHHALLQGLIDIPANASQPVLSFAYMLNLLHDNDEIFVKIQPAGSTEWVELRRYNRRHNRAVNTHEELSLSVYKGQQIRLGFFQNHSLEGVRLFLVDDLRVGDLQLPALAFPYQTGFDDPLRNAEWSLQGAWDIAGAHNSWGNVSGAYHLDANPTEQDLRLFINGHTASLNGYVTIPSGSQQPVVNFKHHLNIVGSEATYYLEIQAQGDDTWTVLNAYRNDVTKGSDNTTSYVYQEFSLDAYKGQAIRMRLRQDNQWDNGASGWVIDDFNIIDLAGVSNQAPVASNQSLTTDEDVAIAVVLTATDGNGDALSYQLVTSPSHGALTGMAPSLSYQPAADFNGTDSFSFMVNDGVINSAVATISIDVSPVNDAPVASDQFISVNEDNSISIVLNGFDVDADVLSYRLIGQPVNGILTGSAPNLGYAPNTNFNGIDEITFVVNDGVLDSDIAIVDINVLAVNDQPVISSSPVLAGTENIPYHYQLTVIDPDSAMLSYSLTSAPSGMSIDSSGLVNWSPDNSSAGNHTIEILVEDGQGGSAVQNYILAIAAANSAPEFVSAPVPFVVAGDNWQYTLEAVDTDGDILSYSMIQAPDGAVFDSVTAQVSWPTSGVAVGNYHFEFSVSDNNAPPTMQVATIEVLPAERAASHEGTDFWIPVSINAVTISTGGTFDINLVSNGTNTTATIEIPALGVVESLSLIANQMATYSIDLDEFAATQGLALNALLENNAIHITAGSPISAYFMSQKTSTTDGFLGLPTSSLGQEYIAATYIMLGKLGSLKTVDGGQLGAIVSIVATEDNTQVTIDPIMDILPGDERQTEVGNPIVLTMNRGDVYNLETRGSFKADLTGSMIVADKPIGVIGQMECVYIPTDKTACDHIVEQLPPIESLATEYYSVPFWGRADNGPISYQEYGDTFRLVAPYDDTAIYIDDVLRARLDQGEYFEYFAEQPQHVSASHPVLMVQYSNGNQLDEGYRELPSNYADPFMVIVPPAEQFLKQYTINTTARSLAYNFVNVVVPTDALLTFSIDGQNIAPDLFTEFPNSEFSYAQLPLLPGSHHLEAQQPFGVYAYGYDYFESYGYLGGMAFSPGRFVSTLSLSGMATQNLDNQWCADAVAVDDYGRPVNGARIRFNVTGASNHDAYEFTDAHGVARYCYTADKPGVDSVTASLNHLSQAISIEWTAGTQNRAPVISSLPNLHIVDGQSYTYDVVAEDPEGGALIYDLVESPGGMSIDATGHLVWPQASLILAQYNRVNVVLSVTDELGLEARQNYELSEYAPFNTPPEFEAATVNLNATQGVPYVYNLNHLQSHLTYLKYQIPVTDTDEDAAFVDILTGPAEAYIQRVLAYYTGILRENDPRSCVGCIHYFRWTPQQVGSQSIVLGLRDARGATAESLSYTVNVVPNLAPEIVDFSPPIIAAVGGQFSYVLNVQNDVPMHEYDNLDDLRVVFEQAPTEMRSELVSANGTQKLRIYWTATASDVGSHTIRLRVDDRLNSSATVEFTLNVIADNQVPVIGVGSMPNAEASIPYQYQISATDPDGDVLTYGLVIAPDGMTVNPTTGVISWLPSADYDNDTEWVRFVVTDARGLTAERSASVYIARFLNRAPEFIPAYRPKFAKVGQQYQHQALATDREGDNPITYSLRSSASGSVIDAQNGTISWTPTTEGSVWFSVSATDSLGNFASANNAFWYVQVVPDSSLLDATLALSPSNVIDQGDTVTLTVVPQNEATTPQVTLTVDGQVVAVDALFQAHITPDRFGRIPVTAVISDGTTSITRSTTIIVRDPADVTPPVVEIHSPTNIGDITAPTAIIGTVLDDGLADVILAYKPANEPLTSNLDLNDFTILYRGVDAFDNQAVATLDTTQLMNGTYHILLQATDANNNTNARLVSVNVSGNLKVGNFSVTFEDIDIPLAGIPIRVTRTYESRRRNENLDFGYGWSIDYQNIRLQESDEPTRGWTQTLSANETFEADPGYINTNAICINPAHEKTVTVTLPNGDIEKFKVVARPSNGSAAAITNPNCYQTTDRIYDVEFIPMGKTTSSLVTTEGGSLYLAELENGYLAPAGDGSAWPITHYTLTTREGFIYQINQSFGVETITDPNGNTITYSDSGIVHSSGKSISFVRDTAGRIAEIIDPENNSVIYTYDNLGNLAAFTDLAQHDTTYSYAVGHYLEDINDPLGQRLLRNIYDVEGRLIAQEDNEGRRTDFNHNVDGRLSIVTDRLNNSTQYVYDDRGNVLSQTDALGNTTSYSYDDDDNQLSKTDPLLHTSLATYNTEGDQLTQTDALGNSTTFTYNSRGQELTISDALGNAFTNGYDTYGNLVSIEDPLQRSSIVEVNLQGQPVRIVDATGAETTFTYNGQGYKETETNDLGHTTTYTYDGNGNVLTESRTRTVDGIAQTEVTRYQYDALNRLVQTTDPLNNVTRQVYDVMGNKVQDIDALGRITAYSYDAYRRLVRTDYPDSSFSSKDYDAEGNLISETDRDGRTTNFSYDPLKRLVRTTYADSSYSEIEYDSAGRVSAEIDANGNRSEYAYDDADRRILSRDALGHETHFAYDANGNLISQTDANGHTTSFYYDALDNRIRTVYPDTTESSQSFDAMGRVTGKTDANGYTTSYVYDTLGRLTQVGDAMLGVDQGFTSYSYDEAGNKLSQIDAEGRITRWSYDALGRELSRQLPLGQVESNSYDAVGDRISHIDFNGQLSSYQYDSNHRLMRVDYADLSFETFGYNNEGQRTSATTRAGASQSWSYDNRGRLSQAIAANGDQLDYGYDNVGNRTGLTVTPVGGTGEVTSYAYDTLNRLASVTDSNAQVTTYGYDNVGNRASVTYPNGNVTTYGYDSLNRLTRQTSVDSLASVLTDYQYTLDSSGHRTQISEAGGRVTDYTYDRLYRLLTETVTDPVNGHYSAAYTYDKVGNRTYSTIDGVQTAYTYDNNDRLTQQGGTSYGYDNNGNTVTETLDGVTDSYSYNVRNELIGSTKGSVTASYAYDIDGIRTQKTEDAITTDYLVDHNRDYAQVLRETRGTDDVNYLYGDDLIRQNRAGGDSYYLYDGLGSTRALTDSTGSVSDTYNYEAFGDILSQSGSTPNEYRFSGEQYDSTLDNYYLRARYYDTDSGRFTQMDTWMGANQDPVTLHKYLYANVNPVNNIDPTGNFSIGSVMSAVNVVATLVTRAEASIELFQIATDEEREFTFRETGIAVLMSLGGGPAKSLGRIFLKGCKGKNKNSFTRGTLVHVPQGLSPIEDIKIGDLVKSFNTENSVFEYKKVTNLVQGYDNYKLVVIYLENNEPIEATLEHPFYSNGIWVNAGDLKVGDSLRVKESSLPIQKIDIINKQVRVYNLTIEDNHNYLIGYSGVLVHNTNVCETISKKAIIKGVKLPTKGKIRYVPPPKWKVKNGLPGNSRTGYIDKFGNRWKHGPSRTPGESFEWDVQLSSKGRAMLGWASRDGKHINVSLDGRITHR